MSFNEFSFFSSDGAGRSGVYISIDANIELSEEDGVFDVYGFLTKMRQQRRGLVETLVSYFDPSLSHTSAVRHKIQSVYCTFPGFFFLFHQFLA